TLASARDPASEGQGYIPVDTSISACIAKIHAGRNENKFAVHWPQHGPESARTSAKVRQIGNLSCPGGGRQKVSWHRFAVYRPRTPLFRGPAAWGERERCARWFWF